MNIFSYSPSISGRCEDEPSNHLDQECIEALGDSLSNWGGKDGSVVVVSHDRAFCEQGEWK